MKHTLSKLLGIYKDVVAINDTNVKLRLSAIFISILLSKIIITYLPVVYGHIIDSLNTKSQATNKLIPIYFIIGYGILRFLSPTIDNLQKVIFAKLITKIKATVFLKTLEHIHNLPHDYHLSNSSGNLIQSLRLGSEAAGNILFSIAFNIIPKTLEIIFAIVVCFYYVNYGIFLTFLATIVILFIYTSYITKWRLKLVKQINQNNKKISSLTVDSFTNFELIKSYLDKKYLTKIQDEWSMQNKLVSKLTFLLFILRACQELVISLAFVIVIFVCSNNVHAQMMSIGSFVMVMTYLVQLLNPFEDLIKQQVGISQQLVDLDETYNITKLQTESDMQDGNSSLDIRSGKIAFDSVAFSYKKNSNLFNNLSFNIKHGSLTILTGPSGVGKSTIFRLLLRFHNIKSGGIYIDDKNISDIDIQSIRKVIGYASQEASIFNNTILYNIVYPNTGADISEMIKISQKLHLHDFVMNLPEGYDTIVGERGLCLSGGQRLRIALARILIKKPKILLLDEINSSLDPETEAAVVEILHLLRGDMTVVCIMHHLPSSLLPDNIIELNTHTQNKNNTLHTIQ